MKECIGSFYLENGISRDTSCFADSSVNAVNSIYEVLRVIDGVPLFLEDHYSRLYNSAKLSGLKLGSSFEELREWVLELGRANKIINGNIKIVFSYDSDKSRNSVFSVKANYPTASMYESGVNTILYAAERGNPGAKVLNISLRSSVNDTLLHHQAYEALLVNSDSCITEGSRSNIFFIEDNRVITAGDNDVLGGITRKYVIGICRERGIKIDYRCLPLEELKSVEAVFLTGTSPHLLPIRAIDNLNFSVDMPLLKDLYTQYSAIVRSYINDHS